MSGHMGEANLPILAHLVSLEQVQELVYLECPLRVNLSTCLAGRVELENVDSEVKKRS